MRCGDGCGVHNPETIQELLKQSRTPDVALVLEAMLIQPQSTSTSILQSVQHIIGLQNTQGVIGRSSPANAAPRLSASEQEDKSRGVVPAQSTNSVHNGDIMYDEALSK
jgi:hypothetical protein